MRETFLLQNRIDSAIEMLGLYYCQQRSNNYKVPHLVVKLIQYDLPIDVHAHVKECCYEVVYMGVMDGLTTAFKVYHHWLIIRMQHRLCEFVLPNHLHEVGEFLDDFGAWGGLCTADAPDMLLVVSYRLILFDTVGSEIDKFREEVL